MCDELSADLFFHQLPQCCHTLLRSDWTIGYNSLLDCQSVDFPFFPFLPVFPFFPFIPFCPFIPNFMKTSA